MNTFETHNRRKNPPHLSESTKSATRSTQNQLSVKSNSKSTQRPFDSNIVPLLNLKQKPEPVYFNLSVSLKRKVNSDNFWDSKQNTDLGKWIRHRRTLERKVKSTIDNKLADNLVSKMEKDRQYKEHLNRKKEDKRLEANKYMRDRVFQARGSIDNKALDSDYLRLRRLSAHLAKTPKPEPITPRTVIREIRQSTPPILKRFSLLPPISERRRATGEEDELLIDEEPDETS